MSNRFLPLFLLMFTGQSFANAILIPMDDSQTNHLKAYGIAYTTLKNNTEIDWLLNYRGGSFLINYTSNIQKECLVRGVSFDIISDADVQTLKLQISSPDFNMEIMRLQKAARIAVYTPSKISDSSFEDTDAVLLVQNHEHLIREFMGQTTAFNKKTVKSNVLVMGESQESYRYIYGEIGLGQWVFYGGHDPEGRRGFHRTPTDLNLFPHSPGYRLFLNNVLFPSAKKKKRKT